MDPGKSSDSDVMKDLNVRFAKYINEIRSLEKKNRTLQVEIDLMRSEAEKKSAQFEKRCANLNAQIQNLIKDKSDLVQQINSLNESLLKEEKQRKEAEQRFIDLQDEKDTEIQDLESEISTLSEQIRKKTKELETLKTEITSSSGDAVDGNTLEEILSKVREEAERIAGNHNDAELKEQHKAKIKELEDRHQEDISKMKKYMESLETKIANQYRDLKHYGEKHERLQSNEISLKAEIIAYRTLLELEEKRVKSNPKDVIGKQ
ncbi:keratin, type II cytoskeletal [Fundulus heteroclitus]|uniref:keratin, type II cytoskeletal n=1 Tax=Fundulus heteroclitus TaxID=8078 RepID=UPI00165AD4C6|nr:keratin, type II cytoskeletal [Fundulus heteroclitus]